MTRLSNRTDMVTKSLTGKEKLHTRRPEGEVGGRGDTLHACANSLFLKLIVILLILTISNFYSYEHNNSVSLTLNVEAVRTGKKHETYCK